MLLFLFFGLILFDRPKLDYILKKKKYFLDKMHKTSLKCTN